MFTSKRDKNTKGKILDGFSIAAQKGNLDMTALLMYCAEKCAADTKCSGDGAYLHEKIGIVCNSLPAGAVREKFENLHKQIENDFTGIYAKDCYSLIVSVWDTVKTIPAVYSALYAIAEFGGFKNSADECEIVENIINDAM